MKISNKQTGYFIKMVLVMAFSMVSRQSFAGKGIESGDWQVQVGLDPIVNGLSSDQPAGNLANLENRFVINRNLGDQWQVGLSYVDVTSNMYSEDGSIFTIGALNRNLIRDKMLGFKASYYTSGIGLGRVYWSAEVLTGTTQLLFDSELKKQSRTSLIGTMGIVLFRLGPNISVSSEFGLKKDLRPASFVVGPIDQQHTITHSVLDKYIGNIYLNIGF